jgi:hypothetical protein
MEVWSSDVINICKYRSSILESKIQSYGPVFLNLSGATVPLEILSNLADPLPKIIQLAFRCGTSCSTIYGWNICK